MQKTLVGKVIANKMLQTCVVEVVEKKPHPLYRKLITRGKKYKVDTTGFTIEAGQTVKIVEVKPISKNKHFKILEIIKEKK